MNLLKYIGLSVIFFVLERFARVLSGVFRLTISLESTIPERMSTVSMSQKLDMSFKGNKVNQKVFPFLPYS